MSEETKVIERRSFDLVDLRVEHRQDGEPGKIEGHAAVFNTLSVPIWHGMRERIKQGAFRKAVKRDDVRALWNHNPDYVLGRTKSKTLTLRVDD